MDELPDVGGTNGQAGAGDGGAGHRSGRPRSGRRPKRQPEPGVSLEEAVRANGPLSLEEAQTLASGLASLLVRLHTAGEVHGDIRPATVFLTSQGPRLDEGDPFRQAAIVADSVYFVAPELLDDPGAISPATDVFALGAVLAFAATGVSPFASRSMTRPGDSSATPDLSAVPEMLRRVIERCLDENAAVRPTAIALSILFAARLESLPAAILPAPPMRAANEADQADQDDRDDQDGAADRSVAETPYLLQKPLFFFARGPRARRAAAGIGALTVAAAIVAAISVGVFGDASRPAAKSARGVADGTTQAPLATTPDAAPVTSSSISPAAPPVHAGSAPSSAPASPPTTSKPAPPPAARPSTSRGGPMTLTGREGSAPAAPGGHRIVSGYVMTADVSWAPAPGATSYEVSYSGSVSGEGTVTTTGTSATLKGLFPSESLCVKVRSVNRYGSSAWVSASSCVMII